MISVRDCIEFSPSVRQILEDARVNAAKRGHRALSSIHVTEAILQSEDGQKTLTQFFGAHLDQRGLLQLIQTEIDPISSEGAITVNEVQGDASYNALLIRAHDKEDDYECGEITILCLLAALAGSMRTRMPSIFDQFGITIDALNVAIGIDCRQCQTATT